MATIDPDIIKRQLFEFECNSKKLGQLFPQLGSNFINAITPYWSSQKAHTFMLQICVPINDCIKQVNEKIPTALEEFTRGVNQVLVGQDEETVPEPSYTPISNVNVTWTPATVFKTPDASEVEDLYKTGYLPVANSINETLIDMKSNISTVIVSGMSGKYLANMTADFTALLESAKDVLDAYANEIQSNSEAADELSKAQQSAN
mgnify:CR=1 FL=1